MPFDNAQIAYYPPVPAPTPYSFSVASNQCDCQGCQYARNEMRAVPAMGWLRDRPPLTPELRRVLTDARELVAKGWGQGADKALNQRFKTEGDPAFVYCARGAVREVLSWSGIDLQHQAVMHLACFTPVPPGWDVDADPEGTVVRYNDSAYTTQADVVRIFDRALA